MPATPATACPECTAGKCVNCTKQVLDADDQWELCACRECGGGIHTAQPTTGGAR